MGSCRFVEFLFSLFFFFCWEKKKKNGRESREEGGGREDVSGYYASVFAVTSRTRLTPEKPHIYIYSLSLFLFHLLLLLLLQLVKTEKKYTPLGK
jgi:hypothetical protein